MCIYGLAAGREIFFSSLIFFSFFLPALEGSAIQSRRARGDPETGPDREKARGVFAQRIGRE
jgi:hypothetical protein